jgi:hypothetical protein
MTAAHYSLDRIVDLLNARHQRATYGAVAAVVGRMPRSLMQGRKRDRRHSWIVNQKTGMPTDYHDVMVHPAIEERDEILETSEQLLAWLANQE